METKYRFAWKWKLDNGADPIAGRAECGNACISGMSLRHGRGGDLLSYRGFEGIAGGYSLVISVPYHDLYNFAPIWAKCFTDNGIFARWTIWPVPRRPQPNRRTQQSRSAPCWQQMARRRITRRRTDPTPVMNLALKDGFPPRM